jgi:hypothetical protein
MNERWKGGVEIKQMGERKFQKRKPTYFGIKSRIVAKVERRKGVWGVGCGVTGGRDGDLCEVPWISRA